MERIWKQHNKIISQNEYESEAYVFLKEAMSQDKIKTNALSLGTGGNILDLKTISGEYEKVVAVDIDYNVVQNIDYVQKSLMGILVL